MIYGIWYALQIIDYYNYIVGIWFIYMWHYIIYELRLFQVLHQEDGPNRRSEVRMLDNHLAGYAPNPITIDAS